MSEVPNPPAFPHGSKTVECPNCNWDVQAYEPGMTLRDYFAGQALAGLLAGPVAYGPILQGKPSALAKGSFNLADAMLTARTQTGAA